MKKKAKENNDENLWIELFVDNTIVDKCVISNNCVCVKNTIYLHKALFSTNPCIIMLDCVVDLFIKSHPYPKYSQFYQMNPYWFIFDSAKNLYV